MKTSILVTGFVALVIIAVARGVALADCAADVAAIEKALSATKRTPANTKHGSWVAIDRLLAAAKDAGAHGEEKSCEKKVALARKKLQELQHAR